MSFLRTSLLFSGFTTILASQTPTHLSHTLTEAEISVIKDTSYLSARTDANYYLSSVGVCKDFSFEAGTFYATCPQQPDNAGPPLYISTSVKLDKCIANENGRMVYRANGNAFQSCTGCDVSDSLDLACSCEIGSGLPQTESSINLAAFAGDLRSNSVITRLSETMTEITAGMASTAGMANMANMTSVANIRWLIAS
ncbi:hypothetical protein GQ44DRAFT_770448 [Phaeosphaeriaceae sp. PMI808]|nr:hypothetical protein GQ44DRAFT_770448 [Phaeosphaeriaceae sp. PMI808]